MEVELKTQAERILHAAGLTSVEAITRFYEYLVSQGQLPGFISKFNSVTLQTFQDTDSGENLVACDHAKDLFDKLGI
jgi:antitoxin component of RelBE/YafQ-DinJ toxin-antitoxin module